MLWLMLNTFFLQVTLTEVYVSEVTEEGKFYACNVADGPALETLMEGLRLNIA